MKRKFFWLLIVIRCLIAFSIKSQEVINIWPAEHLPNSKGIALELKEKNQRVYQVDTPKMYCFFPAQEDNSGAAVLVMPSGGYHHLTYNSGGFQVAKWFNTIGVNAFVLIYRLPNAPDLEERYKGPLQDAQRAMKIIHANTEAWKIDTNKIGVYGSSAGGHLVASLCTKIVDISEIGDSLEEEPYLPDFQILVSPVVSLGKYTHKGSRYMLLGEDPSQELIAAYSNELHVISDTPPAFIVHADNDKAVSPMNSIMYYEALLSKGVSSSIHVFPQGGHGIGIVDNPGSTEMWKELCVEWLKEMDILVK